MRKVQAALREQFGSPNRALRADIIKMNDTFQSQITTALWSDIPEANNFPTARPLWAHYTSVTTLEKMLLADELWLSNPLYMNDWEELRYGMNTGAEEFRTHSALVEACGTKETHNKLMRSFDQLFHAFDSEHAMDTYVLCLAEHRPADNDGVLSMWRGYGANGGGVAIVFDAAKLNAVEKSPFIVSKVEYASHAQRLEWIDGKVLALAQVLSSTERSDENLHYAAHVFLERLKLFALFTKHDGFSEENEWRIVYFSDKDQERQLSSMLGYTITNKGVEPKLKVRINELPGALTGTLSLNNLIERIILGPSISTILAANSVKRMLELNGRSELALRVVASSIPFRP